MITAEQARNIATDENGAEKIRLMQHITACAMNEKRNLYCNIENPEVITPWLKESGYKVISRKPNAGYEIQW